MEFLSPGVVLYVYKSTIHLCMEYCFHAWAGALSCYLELLINYKIFDRCSSELSELVALHFSRGRSTRYSDRMHDFSVTIPRCCKNVLVNNFFPRTAKVLKFLPVECFPLNYDLNSCKPRTNQHLLKPFCTSFSCNSIACSGCPALHGVNPD